MTTIKQTYRVINLTYPNGENIRRAAHVFNELFGMHKEDPTNKDSDYTITHVPSGYRFIGRFSTKLSAETVINRTLLTLTDAQIEKLLNPDPEKMTRMRLAKQVFKYMTAARQCENNLETEKLLGMPFYRDREHAERLRMKLNPEANTLLDNMAIGSESLTASLISGSMKLPE